MANDHQGSEIGKPETRWTAQPIALPSTMPSTPPSEVRNAASIRNWNRISARRAPSALRTPISRVRSVTEIDMIAITPMPPTISAIDEMTISAKNVALADLIPQLQERLLRRDVEVVRLVELAARGGSA